MFEEDNSYAKARAKRITKKVVAHVFLVLISLIWLFPFIYLVLQSLSDTYVAANFLPEVWTFKHYILLFTDQTYPFFDWFLRTLIIALVTSVLQTIVILMTSYALSRLRFKIRKPFMKFILIIGMFPSFLNMIAIYFILDLMGLTTSIYSLIIIYVGGAAMSYYISKGFFDTVSHSLDEAAMIDGANKNTIFFRVIMPLSKPIIIYTVLMAFTAPWGDFMMASYLAAGNGSMTTVAVGLQRLVTLENLNLLFPRFCAGGVFTSIPIVLLFFVLQRYYVEGITGGSVKG